MATMVNRRGRMLMDGMGGRSAVWRDALIHGRQAWPAATAVRLGAAADGTRFRIATVGRQGGCRFSR